LYTRLILEFIITCINFIQNKQLLCFFIETMLKNIKFYSIKICFFLFITLLLVDLDNANMTYFSIMANLSLFLCYDFDVESNSFNVIWLIIMLLIKSTIGYRMHYKNEIIFVELKKSGIIKNLKIIKFSTIIINNNDFWLGLWWTNQIVH
jgi:hypothetical protein